MPGPEMNAQMLQFQMQQLQMQMYHMQLMAQQQQQRQPAMPGTGIPRPPAGGAAACSQNKY
jgi:hypothetical protein